jgi:glycosyltransferase involved in cell wall biosynthesis
MRVLLLNYEYPPLGGGAGVATEALARGLASRGCAVDVVTAGVHPSSTSELLWDGAAASEGVLTVHRVRSRRTGIHEAGLGDAASYLAAALPLTRRLLARAHYDVAHFFFSLPTGALLPLLNLGDTAVVVSLRGSDVPGYDPSNGVLQRAHRVLLPFTRWIWHRADRVVALSDSLGRLAQRSDPALRYSVIRNGVDISRFRPPASSHPLRLRPVRCVAVARLVERKGLADLIGAIARLERGRYELEIIGGGPDEQSLRQTAERLGVGPQVRFTGALDHAAVARRYRQADLFTLASWEESFGNVFAEALASGLPIIGSTAGGIPEFVEHCRNGLLEPPRTPEALAQAIRRLGDDPRLRREMSRANRAKAEATLSWSQVTSRYLSIYHGVQRRSPARALMAELPSSIW